MDLVLIAQLPLGYIIFTVLFALGVSVQTAQIQVGWQSGSEFNNSHFYSFNFSGERKSFAFNKKQLTRHSNGQKTVGFARASLF